MHCFIPLKLILKKYTHHAIDPLKSYFCHPLNWYLVAPRRTIVMLLIIIE